MHARMTSSTKDGWEGEHPGHDKTVVASCRSRYQQEAAAKEAGRLARVSGAKSVCTASHCHARMPVRFLVWPPRAGARAQVVSTTPVLDPQEILKTGAKKLSEQKRVANFLANGQPDQGGWVLGWGAGCG